MEILKRADRLKNNYLRMVVFYVAGIESRGNWSRELWESEIYAGFSEWEHLKRKFPESFLNGVISNE